MDLKRTACDFMVTSYMKIHLGEFVASIWDGNTHGQMKCDYSNVALPYKIPGKLQGE